MHGKRKISLQPEVRLNWLSTVHVFTEERPSMQNPWGQEGLKCHAGSLESLVGRSIGEVGVISLLRSLTVLVLSSSATVTTRSA